MLVAQDRVRVERFQRDGELWVMDEASGSDGVLVLTPITCERPLRDIYARVESPNLPLLRRKFCRS